MYIEITEKELYRPLTVTCNLELYVVPLSYGSTAYTTESLLAFSEETLASGKTQKPSGCICSTGKKCKVLVVRQHDLLLNHWSSDSLIFICQ